MRGLGATRGQAGPSGGYAGPIVAAALALVGGVFLAGGLLAIQPVRRVKEAPAASERGRDGAFYLEGRQDPSRRRSAAQKVDLLLRGREMEFSEEELNALLEAAVHARREARSRSAVTVETANVRIRAGTMQIGVELQADILGLAPKFFVQSRGQVVADSGRWVFVPTELHVGALPLETIPGALDWVREHWLDPTRLYPEWAAAWSRIGGIKVEGDVVRVSSR